MKFDRSAATQADRGSIIESSGVYRGVITNAIVKDSDSGASFVQFDFMTDNNESAKYVRLYTKKKDGSNSFGYAIFQSLLGILKIDECNPVKEGDEWKLPVICNKQIGFALQKEWYTSKDGSLKWKMSLLHFFDYSTLKTYSEREENKEAMTSKRIIKDKQQESIPTANIDSEPLPF